MRLPVYCPDCRGVFLSRCYNVAGTNVRLWNNTEPCIFCGSRRAHLSEGVFNIVGDVVEILVAPQATLAAFQRLAAVANDVSAGKISTEEGIKRAEAITPGLGAVMSKWIAANLLGLAALILQGYQLMDAKADDAERDAQIERLIRATERLQTQQQASQDSPAKAAKAKNRKARRADAAKQRKANKIAH